MVNFGSVNTASPTDKHSLFGSIYSVYDNLNEKKNNAIAVTVSGKEGSQKRASAATIGAVGSLINFALLFGVYSVLKVKPKWNNKLLDKYVVKSFDKWINIAKKNTPNKSKFYQTFTGLYAKAIWATISGAVTGYGWGLYRTIKGTFVNGKIGSTRAGVQGSWISSGLKNLSQTEEGKELIKNSITKNKKDKTVTVRFNGIDKEYTITKKELKNASKQYLTDTDENGKVKGYERKFSKGDGDVLAFEVAFEKYCRDVKDGKVAHDNNITAQFAQINEDGDIIFAKGSENDLYYLLTGQRQISFTGTEIGSENAKTLPINDKGGYIYTYNGQPYVIDRHYN